MIIDINMHWLPKSLFSDVTNANELSDNISIFLEKAIKDLSRMRIRKLIKKKAILRIPCWQEWLNLDMCKQVNDLLAKDIKQHPDRFLGLAVVPPWGDRASFKEVEHCIKDLGFCGVEIAAHYGTLYLDEEEFKPLFKKLNELNVPVCVHHTPLPVDYHSVYKYTNQRRLYGRCIDQATAVGRELFSGMFEEFPNLRLVHTMLGGGFFAYVNLLIPKSSGVQEEMERFDTAAEKIRSYLDRNIYFGITHAPVWGKDQLECAIKVFGADHVLFGSSYPLRHEWLLKGVDFIRSLEIGEKEKAQILGENAIKLFNIPL
jgi:predicted TIM-barrel fold metal-dependent hydrolase